MGVQRQHVGDYFFLKNALLLLKAKIWVDCDLVFHLFFIFSLTVGLNIDHDFHGLEYPVFACTHARIGSRIIHNYACNTPILASQPVCMDLCSDDCSQPRDLRRLPTIHLSVLHQPVTAPPAT